MNNNNKPKLRFKGDYSDWDNITLEDKFIKICDKNTDNKITNVISNSSKYGLIRQDNYFKKDIANEDNTSGYYVIKENDFVYNSRKSEDSPYGPVKIYKLHEKGIVSPLYLCFRQKEKINIDFFINYFESPKWYKYVHINGNLGARLGRVSINDKDFFKMPISIPNENEQKKIAEFLSKVDEMIDFHSNKLEALLRLKKGLMQKIFSREVRFKEEEGKEFGEWEIKKLGDVCDDFIVPMRDKPKKFGGIIPWCRIEDIDGKFINGTKSNQYVSYETIDEMNLKIMPIGTVICSCSASLGTYAISTTQLITNQTFIGLVCGSKLLNNFLYYYMSTQTKSLKHIAGGTTIPYISRKKFEDYKILLPELKEQNLIAEFLSKFDELIDVEKEISERWKAVKKGLLQQMFV